MLFLLLKRLKFTIEIIPHISANILIWFIKFLAIIYDLSTILVYVLWQKPWRIWPKILCNRSIEDLDYPEKFVRKSIKTIPEDYFLNNCQTLDEAFKIAYEIYGPNRKCLGYRKILEQQPFNEPPYVRYRLDNNGYQWFNWKQMMDSIESFANGLKFLTKSRKSDPIVIYAQTSYQWFIAGQAIIKNGSILTTLYSTLGLDGVQKAIEETKVKVLITTKSLLMKLLLTKSKINYQKRQQEEVEDNNNPDDNDMDQDGYPGGYTDDEDDLSNTEILNQIKFIILLDCHQSEEGSEELDQIRDLLIENDNNNITDEIKLLTYEQVLNYGNQEENPDSIKDDNQQMNDPDDICVIMYTSGSGGKPKGVLMTHRNLLNGFKGHVSLIQGFLNDVENHTYLAYLPLAHILEFGTETMVILIGACLGYSNPHTITDLSAGLIPGTLGDATLLKPTVMTAVPLVLDRIRKSILVRLNQNGLIVKKFFEFLVEYKQFWISKGFSTPILDKIFLRKFKKLIGGNLKAILVGGAPLSSDTQKWIRSCLNVIFVQGYGSTETVGGGLFMDEYDFTLAKVGGPLYGTKISLVDWIEGGYTTKDKPNPRGEIHLSCQALSIGYFGLKKLNQETFYYDQSTGERWFRTGDIGEMFPNGTFKIIDRKKDFIKLHFGEYVSLGKIETKLKTSYLINQICLVGDQQRKYLIAIIIPNPKVMENILEKILAKKRRMDPNNNNNGSMDSNNIRIQEKIFQKKLKRFCSRIGLKHYEIPRYFILDQQNEWTPENGLVTASFKLKRKRIEQFYQREILKIQQKQDERQ